ncbi:MAG: PHP domain-containing protein [Anaerolineae bacterium]|nr:PHP domain-containing protein [Anaerolineae bacterium]
MLKQSRADLHMHTTVSDGLASVRQVLDQVAQQRELAVIAITDHDRLDASLWAYERRHRYPFEIVPGVEVSSAEAHVLALWVTEPIPRALSLAETIAAIHEQDGIAILAHPFHFQMGFVARHAPKYFFRPQLLIDWGLDAIEVHNAGVLIPGTNLLARHLAHRIGLPQVGNSDAHTLGAIGTGQTVFPGQTADDLRQAILNGTTCGIGSAWGITDYLAFTRDLIQRRGRCNTGIGRELESA